MLLVFGLENLCLKVILVWVEPSLRGKVVGGRVVVGRSTVDLQVEDP